MLTQLRRGYWALGGSAAQLVIVVVAAQFESVLAWRVAAVAVAAMSLLSWVLALRHVRAISDTPTSKIASAAQGYVELQGHGRPFGGPALLSPLSLSPCLWYRFQIEVRHDNKWRTESKGVSDASFVLDDDTGICLVDPEFAEVITAFRRAWTEGDRRYTEWRIHEGEPVYALGQFMTKGHADLDLDFNEDMKLLLAEWKKDPVRLNERFDLDRDGALNLREWELARAQAHREVLAMHRESRLQSDIHLMRAPGESHLYLIATITPEQILRRYRLWAGFHVLCFFVALGAFAHLLRVDSM